MKYRLISPLAPPIGRALLLCLPLLLSTGCTTPKMLNMSSADDVRRLDLKLSSAISEPKPHSDQYTSALVRLGSLMEIYKGVKSKPIYVQTKSVGDATGLSAPLIGAELPGDITEMVRSAINNIGSLVVYTPFHPEYVVAHAQQGVNMNVTVPDILVTGAITQFDRSVVSAGKSRDVGFLFGAGRGETTGTGTQKSSSTISKLGLDFNVVDFKTQTMIPRVQAVNLMSVINESTEGAIDFSIIGNGIGMSSSARQMQGRHQAVRSLVEISVIQLIGRYTSLPYWRILPDTEVDEVVLDRLRRAFSEQTPRDQVAWIQNTVKDFGEHVEESGQMDTATARAVLDVFSRLDLPEPTKIVSADVFVSLFINVPLPSRLTVFKKT
ncbi:MAG: hypothetical protein Q7U28_10335 [Aquabacterium sp.]|nr:hypothetical protein [Aquabacterium sp.]